MTLTPNQRQVLEFLGGEGGAASKIALCSIRLLPGRGPMLCALRQLRRRRLVEPLSFARGYRITPAGRRALEGSAGDAGATGVESSGPSPVRDG